MINKIRTIISDDPIHFDSKVNEFISSEGIAVVEINFCSDSSEYIAHIQYMELDDQAINPATIIKPFSENNLQYQH